MVNHDMTPVARQRVWEEHLLKVAAQERRYSAAAGEVHCFSVNPMKLKGKTMTDPKINRRESRFLDRERAALESIQRQLAGRIAAEQTSTTPLPIAAADVPLIPAARNLPDAAAAVGNRSTSLPPIRGATVDTKAASSKPRGRFDTEAGLLEAMATVHQGPTAKYAFPQTESQEVGWMSRPLVRPDRHFHHGLKTCDVTRYATFAVQRM
jgi:hypothetical protein